MHLTQQEYRLIPDQRLKVAEYRLHWVIGKLIVLLMLTISTPVAYGLNQACDFSLWWLFVVPALLLVGLFWNGFPAFCRCPSCKKRMASRSKAGKVINSHKLFDEIGPTTHYLVCNSCKLYLFLGESDAG